MTLGEGKIVYTIWVTLVVAIVVSLLDGRWWVAFVAGATLVLSLLPRLLENRLDIRLPVSFFAAIFVFLFATLFLGEAFNFYERYWWWDVALHAVSAAGLGLAGFLFVFMLFEGDRYAAPARGIAFIAFCVGISLGVIWEIFEFAMDEMFGSNMQKSGLSDTMWDLIVDVVGASIGACAGLFYLKGRQLGGMSGFITEFIRLNRNRFRKFRKDRSDR